MYKLVPSKRYEKGNFQAELEKRPKGYRIKFFVDGKYANKMDFPLGKPHQTMAASRAAAMKVIKANEMKLVGDKRRKK